MTKTFALTLFAPELAAAIGEPAHVNQVRAITAAPSQKAAAERLGVTAGHLRNYGDVTGNERDIALAAAHPDHVVARRKNGRSEVVVVAAYDNHHWTVLETHRVGAPSADLVEPITTVEEAEAWLRAMYAQYGPWHPDDPPAEVIRLTGDGAGTRVFDDPTAALVDARLDEVFAVGADPYSIVAELLGSDATA